MSLLSAIVLAAGQGTRMKSALPKPVHRVCGRPLVNWVLQALTSSAASQLVVVVGHGSEIVTAEVNAEDLGKDTAIRFVEQRSQRGTGDAASVGLTGLPDDPTEMADVIILPGDTPLLTSETISDFVAFHRSKNSVCTIMTAVVDDPTGYGRIIRNRHGEVERIVEQKDGSPEELEVTEVNAGIYCFRQVLLAPALRRVTPDNAQGEFYLTDVIGVLRTAGYSIEAHAVADPGETAGVNDRAQLMAAEGALRERINTAWMKSGVSILDPAGTRIDASVVLGEDVTVLPGSALHGATTIGTGSVIGPNTSLTNCTVGDGATIAQSVGNDASIGGGATVGPFVVLESGAKVADGAVVAPHTVVEV